MLMVTVTIMSVVIITIIIIVIVIVALFAIVIVATHSSLLFYYHHHQYHHHYYHHYQGKATLKIDPWERRHFLTKWQFVSYSCFDYNHFCGPSSNQTNCLDCISSIQRGYTNILLTNIFCLLNWCLWFFILSPLGLDYPCWKLTQNWKLNTFSNDTTSGSY